MQVWVDNQNSDPTRVIVNAGQPVMQKQRWRASDPLPHTGLQMIVSFGEPDPDGARPVTGVELKNPEGLSPSELRRFAWVRWIRVAEAWARIRYHFTVAGGSEYDRSVRSVAVGLGAKVPPPRANRPGQRGHPTEHYAAVADRYLALVEDGERYPVKIISAERNANRNTVAGWIKECRRRKLLPPALKGRAG